MRFCELVDRGHMVPAADAKSSQQAMDETFILTNVAPQVGEGFNRNCSFSLFSSSSFLPSRFALVACIIVLMECLIDWAYLEAFCRNLTNQFDDVYVFTIPLFLPKQFPDNKWRVVRLPPLTLPLVTHSIEIQSYEMLAPQGGAPSIAVPTHFAKVILAARSSPGSFWSKDSSAGARKEERGLEVIGNGEGREWSLGAFVLPNQVIPDQLRLETFLVPGSSALRDAMRIEGLRLILCSTVEAVESSAGLTLLPPTIKSVARPLCATVSCELTIRRFDDAAKKSNGGKGNGKGKNGRPELTRSSTL